MNLKHTDISKLLLLPGSYNIKGHEGSIKRILNEHHLFRELYQLEISIQTILTSMEETGLIIARKWLKSGLFDKHTQLKETALEINKYIDGSGDNVDKKLVNDYLVKRQLQPANTYRDLAFYKEVHPIYNLLLKHKKYESYIKQWGTKLKLEGTNLDDDVLIKGRWQSFSSYTGRLTCRKLPLTSLPYAMREYVVAPKGFSMISLDISLAELRFLAYYAEKGELVKMLSKSGDIHQETAELIKRNVSDGNQVDDETARSLAKSYTYGLLYGAGTRRITELLQKKFHKVTSADVTDINNEFTSKYPEVIKFLHDRGESKQLLTPYGKIEPARTFGYTEKLNFTLQSSVSVAIKLIMNVVSKKFSIAHVLHDEIWVLVPSGYPLKNLENEITKEIKKRIQDIFPGFLDNNLLTIKRLKK